MRRVSSIECDELPSPEVDYVVSWHRYSIAGQSHTSTSVTFDLIVEDAVVDVQKLENLPLSCLQPLKAAILAIERELKEGGAV